MSSKQKPSVVVWAVVRPWKHVYTKRMEDTERILRSLFDVVAVDVENEVRDFELWKGGQLAVLFRETPRWRRRTTWEIEEEIQSALDRHSPREMSFIIRGIDFQDEPFLLS